MLIHITADNDDALSLPVTFAAGDQIDLDEDATITSQADDGIFGPAAANGATMTLLGSIQAGKSAVCALSGGHAITIGSNGSLYGSFSGILLDENGDEVGGNIVQNSGSVGTSMVALGPYGIAISAHSSNNQVLNTGTISGYLGVTLGLGGVLVFPAGNTVVTSSSNNSVVNSGTINATSSAVTLFGDGSSLNNDKGGTITGAFTVALYGNAQGTISVFNAGTIQSTNGTAITGADEADLIHNSGAIAGSIFLNDGNDLYDGGLGTISGAIDLGAGDDVAYGGAGAESLDGGADNDTLEGGGGNDTLNGGAEIDTAVFSGTVGATVDLKLIDVQQDTHYGLDVLTGIENLTGGAGADRFTGDGNANVLTGGLGGDVLNGGLGNDILDGGEGLDTAIFNGTIAAAVDLTLTGQQDTHHGLDVLTGIENLTGGTGADRFIGDGSANQLIGELGADTLTGGGGSDLRNGGLGNDRLDGGSGLDVLRFTGAAAATVNLGLKGAQNTGYGLDTVLGIEILWGGIGADRFTGNSANNAFIGEAGRDTIAGGGGHDTIAGGAGNDRLSGGSGKDVFVFDTKPNKSANVDTITDFKRVDDTFRLENAIFSKLDKTGLLKKSCLKIGSKAKDKDDYIVYDKAKGALYYDADGSGKGAAVKFAQIAKGTVLDHKDFFII
jgi:hypothetical protein